MQHYGKDAQLNEAISSLEKILDSQLQDVISCAAEEYGTKNSLYIEIPDPNVVDLTQEDLASLVARTSNTFGRASRMVGRAKAKARLVEARYKHKFKTSYYGKNTAERESNAYAASSTEHTELALLQSVVELATALESAARIASESSRKLYSTVDNIGTAQRREDKGRLKESDFEESFGFVEPDSDF